MKERPILFSAPMVRALLDGSKTQTRRIVKLPKTPDHLGQWEPTTVGGSGVSYTDGTPVPLQGAIWHTRTGECIGSPYGQPSDEIWVKETFYAWGEWNIRFNIKKGRNEWHFIDRTTEANKRYQYVADGPLIPIHKRGEGLITWWKRPAIFMPRAASRIQLEITNIRVERLRDISEFDAIAEGYPYQAATKTSVLQWYFDLWQSINGAASLSLDPWVWVIEFRRIKP